MRALIVLFSFISILMSFTAYSQVMIGSDGSVDASAYQAVAAQETVGLRFVLLRGLIREKRHWGSFPQKLQALFPEAEIVSLDVPGAGEYYKKSSPMSIGSYVDILKQDLVEKSVLKRKTITVMIAISLGAMIATNWAYLYPEQDFQKMVLINPSFKGFCSLFERFRIFDNENYKHMWNFVTSKNEQFVANMVVNDKSKHPDLVRKWQSIRQDAPVSFSNTLRQLWAAIWYQPSKVPPASPVLLLNAQADKLVSPECSTAIHKAWGAPIFYHKTAGHDLPADDAEWVLKHIKDFI